MERFIRHEGIAVPLLIDNINTDQIIPSREMKRVSKKGLGDGLFANMRYSDAAAGGRTPNSDFMLNHARYRGATILLAGSNFGCGSSREHAVWALHEYGFRVIVAVSFGTIFFENCIANGILPITLARPDIERITEAAVPIEVDLEQKMLTTNAGPLAFDLEERKRQLLIAGLKPLDLALQHQDAIAGFIARDRTVRPWVYDRSTSMTKEPM